MIIITINDSLGLGTAKVYTQTKPGAIDPKKVKQRKKSPKYSLNHGSKQPKKIDITLTKTNPTCVQIGGRLFCW